MMNDDNGSFSSPAFCIVQPDFLNNHYRIAIYV